MIPEWLPLDWVTLTLGTVATFYLYLTWNNNYWKRKNIPFVKPDLFFGNYTDIFLSRTTVGEKMELLYKTFPGKPFVGFWRFRSPGILAKDPEVARTVLLKDMSSFEKNAFHVDPNHDPLMYKNPFFQFGDKWKTIRQTLTPSFTNAKLKILLSIMEEVSAELVEYLRTEGIKHKDGLETKDLSSKYTMEIVATCAFGIKSQCFKNPKAHLRQMTMQIVRPGLLKNIELMIINFLPTLGSILKLRWMPKDVDRYYRKILRDVMDDREKKNTTRNDYLQNLINLKKKSSENGTTFTDEDVTGHVVTFLTDGFETSSITLAFVLYELACNPEVQEELRQEVVAARRNNGGALPFESLIELPFLEQVIEETLRLHSPLMTLEKFCTRATVLRASDGTECPVFKGQHVVLPVRAFHHDPQYFPDPERFDPGRFSRARRNEFPKYAYLPFGEGPRMCLGMRFALQQIKLAIVSIVENFTIKKTPKTPKYIEQDPTYFLSCAKGGLWVGFEERKST